MDNVKTEEKSPLLLYMVEGEGNGSKNNKRVNFEKGRLYGISSGATAVFTEFPNYVSPCWITALISSLIFFMMVMLMVSSMESVNHSRVPRCTHSHSDDVQNVTIFLVHDSTDWYEEQLEILEKINTDYDGYNVHLTLLRQEMNKKNNHHKESLPIPQVLENTSVTVTSKTDVTSHVNKAVIEIKRAQRNKRGIRRKKREPMGLGMGVKGLLDILLHSRMDNNGNIRHNDTQKPLNLTALFPTLTTEEAPRSKTLDDVIANFPKMFIRNVTFEEAFLKTPLEKSWNKLEHDLKIFALRIVELWQYAGLSFKLDGVEVDKIGKDTNNFSVTPDLSFGSYHEAPIQLLRSSNKNKLLNFVNAGKSIYDTLPKEVVRADDEGVHVITKTPCHVFFGEVLFHLKHAKGDETPKMILQRSLKVFCKHSAVGQNYCKHLITKQL